MPTLTSVFESLIRAKVTRRRVGNEYVVLETDCSRRVVRFAETGHVPIRRRWAHCRHMDTGTVPEGSPRRRHSVTNCSSATPIDWYAVVIFNRLENGGDSNTSNFFCVTQTRVLRDISANVKVQQSSLA